VHRSPDVPVRVAAAQTIGAFAAPAYVMEHLAQLADDPRPALRGALLWALQLAARPVGFSSEDRVRAEGIVRRALGDADPMVRRRAAYVAGNLDAISLVPDLVTLAREETSAPDLRVAAFVGLAEIGSPARFADLLHLWNREDDPEVLGAASRAIERALVPRASGTDRESSPSSEVPSVAPPSMARVHDRLRKLIASPDKAVRSAAARVAGLAPGSVPIEALAALVEDETPRVREQAVVALGRLALPECEPALARALDDADPAVQEHAASALLALRTGTAAARVVDFVSRTPDHGAAVRLADHLTVPRSDEPRFVQALDAALARVGHDHPTYETLLELKLRALEATRPTSAAPGVSVDAAIAALFPTWTRLSAVRGFAPLGKSLRTAEMLHASTVAGADADCAAPIVLWMKSLEGYMHAWLAPRFSALQERPSTLWELTDKVGGTSWPVYQRWLAERWSDTVDVGGMAVEVPLRSSVNALRELQERRLKSLDSPLSVTEWARLMLFFAVDHPSGARNVLKVTAQGPERTVRLAHELQVLAQVRNAVTHRSVAALSTLTAFRGSYYASFEDLTGMA
jgi:HEAT repeat protein